MKLHKCYTTRLFKPSSSPHLSSNMIHRQEKCQIQTPCKAKTAATRSSTHAQKFHMPHSVARWKAVKPKRVQWIYKGGPTASHDYHKIAFAFHVYIQVHRRMVSLWVYTAWGTSLGFILLWGAKTIEAWNPTEPHRQRRSRVSVFYPAHAHMGACTHGQVTMTLSRNPHETIPISASTGSRILCSLFSLL